MSDILWISASVPYDTVAHAGGKTHNYYLKYLTQNTQCNVKLLSFYWKEECAQIDLAKYRIDNILLKRAVWEFPRTLINLESFINPFHRYAGIDQNYTVYQFRKALSKIQKEGFSPKIVIMQWTEMLVLIDIAKSFFPSAKIIGIEEDVKFQSYERAYQNMESDWKRFMKGIRYRKLKRIEVEACKKADKIVVNNGKDKDLLLENGIAAEHIHMWHPFFENKVNNPYWGIDKSIVFYGAMGREENWKSAIWFIENVFYRIDDHEANFYVIGAHPNPKLLKYESDRVKILGYVESIDDYFAKASCMVAPLLFGAGIKVKILEALSAGVPVITNQVGIEGIPARKDVEYLHCEAGEEYVKAINTLLMSKERRMKISRNEKSFIKNNYDLQQSAYNFAQMLSQIQE